jgi:hypothetical protein
MRKSRLEEAKQRDPEEAEVHRATTVFHGTPGEYGNNRTFIDPPSYLR